MPKLVYIVPAVLAVSCAAQRGEMSLVAPVGNVTPTEGLISQADITPTAAEAPLEAVDVKTVEFEELDNGLVCEPRQRAASRLTRKVCYTREEYAARQVQQREQAEDYVARDREWHEEQERVEQMLRPTVPGL
jgi:hypothetical protein